MPGSSAFMTVAGGELSHPIRLVDLILPPHRNHAACLPEATITSFML